MKKSVTQKVFVALMTVLVTGCSGGGTNNAESSSLPLPVTPTTVQIENPLILPKYIELPDLRPAFNQLCGNATQVRDILVADVNGDRRKDLLVTMNCMQPVFGVVVHEPVKAGFVVFTQNKDGTFLNETRNIFGNDLIMTGGYIINAVTTDFNKDGYSDFICSLNREDGRAYADNYGTNLNHQNLFVTSETNGKYNVIKQGQSAWNYVLKLVDNAVGSSDVVSQPIGYQGVNEQWTFSNGWKQLENLPWSTPGTVFLRRMFDNQGSTIAINPDRGETFGISLYQKNTSWVFIDSLSFGKVTHVPWVAWSKEKGSVMLLTINNVDYVNATLETSCDLKLRKTDSNSVAVFSFQATPLKNRYVEGTTLTEGDPAIFNDVENTLIGAFNFNGKLQKINLEIANQVKNVSPFRMYCGDVSGDGDEDIVISDWRENTSPIIYVNDGTGSFLRVDPKYLPAPNTTEFRSEAFIFTDINSDGFSDYISYPTDGLSTNASSSTPVILRFYPGGRKIKTSDFM